MCRRHQEMCSRCQGACRRCQGVCRRHQGARQRCHRASRRLHRSQQRCWRLSLKCYVPQALRHIVDLQAKRGRFLFHFRRSPIRPLPPFACFLAKSCPKNWSRGMKLRHKIAEGKPERMCFSDFESPNLSGRCKHLKSKNGP